MSLESLRSPEEVDARDVARAEAERIRVEDEEVFARKKRKRRSWCPHGHSHFCVHCLSEVIERCHSDGKAVCRPGVSPVGYLVPYGNHFEVRPFVEAERLRKSLDWNKISVFGSLDSLVTSFEECLVFSFEVLVKVVLPHMTEGMISEVQNHILRMYRHWDSEIRVPALMFWAERVADEEGYESCNVGEHLEQVSRRRLQEREASRRYRERVHEREGRLLAD